MSSTFCCRAVGITVTVLAGMQWLTAVFWRPDRGVQLRRWWNVWHHSWGRIAFALAIANIYVGLCITQPGTRYFVGQTVVFGILFALVSCTHTFVTSISKGQQLVDAVNAPGCALQVVLKNDIEYLMKPWTPATEEDADMKRLLTGKAEQSSAICPACHLLHHFTAFHGLQVGSQQGLRTTLAHQSQQTTTQPLQRQPMATRRPWCKSNSLLPQVPT